jgi:hypothetical protein
VISLLDFRSKSAAKTSSRMGKKKTILLQLL